MNDFCFLLCVDLVRMELGLHVLYNFLSLRQVVVRESACSTSISLGLHCSSRRKILNHTGALGGQPSLFFKLAERSANITA